MTSGRAHSCLLSNSPGGCTRREVCPGRRIFWEHHFGGRGGNRGSAMVPFKKAMVVFYYSSPLWSLRYLKTFGRNLLPNVSGAQINRSILVPNFWRKRLIDVSQILKQSERDIRLSNSKEIVTKSYAVWSHCTNMTGRLRNSNIETNRRNRFQLCRLIIVTVMVNGKWLLDFIERLKASAW